MVEGADKVGFFVGELSVGTLDGAMVGETVGPRVGKEQEDWDGMLKVPP